MPGPEIPGVPARNMPCEIIPTHKKIEAIDPSATTNAITRDLPRDKEDKVLVTKDIVVSAENNPVADVIEIGRQPDSIDKLKNYGRDGRLEK